MKITIEQKELSNSKYVYTTVSTKVPCDDLNAVEAMKLIEEVLMPRSTQLVTKDIFEIEDETKDVGGV